MEEYHASKKAIIRVDCTTKMKAAVSSETIRNT
jgi:hypothetical protein